MNRTEHDDLTDSVGLVHDYLLVMRGAERTFAEIAALWGGAQIYTTLHDPSVTENAFGGHPIRTSYLQRLGVGQRRFRYLLPLYPRAVERLPVGLHNLIISSSSAFAHGIHPGREAVHVCYCYTPFRYVWHDRELALREANRGLRPVLARTLDRLRAWDLEASKRVTHYVAISELVRRRIADCYGRAAAVVHPPVNIDRFSPGRAEGFFLVVTELVRHKRVDLALRAAAMANVPIKVVGGGPELRRWRAEYSDRAEFLGRVSDSDLEKLMPRALALVVPNVEEFGIAAVEAQAAGRPVLAADGGGARETVLAGETGVLVPPDSVGAFAEAMREVDFSAFDPVSATRNAARFSKERFQERFLEQVRIAGGQRDARAPDDRPSI